MICLNNFTKIEICKILTTSICKNHHCLNLKKLDISLLDDKNRNLANSTYYQYFDLHGPVQSPFHLLKIPFFFPTKKYIFFFSKPCNSKNVNKKTFIQDFFSLKLAILLPISIKKKHEISNAIFNLEKKYIQIWCQSPQNGHNKFKILQYYTFITLIEFKLMMSDP